MARILALLAAGLLLTACESSPDMTADAAKGAPNAYCNRVAADQAQDAAYNGFGDNYQRAVYQRAYKDCSQSTAELVDLSRPSR